MTAENNSKSFFELVNFQSIEDLKPLADELNAESDDLNETINAVSEKLAALNFGIEVWYHSDDKPEDSIRPFDAQIGFARIPETKRWALATRTYISDTAPNKPVWEIRSLIKAPREVRIAALETLPWIIDRIRQKAQNSLAFIRKARKLAIQSPEEEAQRQEALTRLASEIEMRKKQQEEKEQQRQKILATAVDSSQA